MIGIFPACEPPDKSQMNMQGYTLKSPFCFVFSSDIVTHIPDNGYGIKCKLNFSKKKSLFHALDCE